MARHELDSETHENAQSNLPGQSISLNKHLDKGRSHPASGGQMSKRDHREWDRLLARAGLRRKKTAHDHNNPTSPTAPQQPPPDKDHLYDLIDAPGRENEEKELFGIAKPFPEVTRNGYRAFLHDYLKNKGSANEDFDSTKKRILTVGDHIFYRLRTKFHAELAEFLGMFVFLCIGYSASCQHLIGGAKLGNYMTLVFTWGVGNMIGVYIAGGYSGAHLNPVLTMNLWFFRGFPGQRVFGFWVAQFLGALAASAWIFILYYPALRKLDPDGWSLSTGSAFYTVPDQSIPVASAWFNEVTNTALIHVVIFALGDSHNINPARGMNALVIGFAVAAIGSSLGVLSPFGMNPFRDFAPRIFLSMVGFPKQLWTYSKLWWLVGGFTGPMLGSFIGCLAYDFFVFDGPESPVNYPQAIKKRALKFFMHDIAHSLDPSYRKEKRRLYRTASLSNREDQDLLLRKKQKQKDAESGTTMTDSDETQPSSQESTPSPPPPDSRASENDTSSNSYTSATRSGETRSNGTAPNQEHTD